MTTAEFLSLFGLAMTAGWTPGPNNAIAAGIGAHFGFRKAIGHIFGVGLGFPFMIFCIAFGLGALFQQSVLLRETLRIVGIAVLFWFTWKIATAGRPSSKGSGAKPLSFLQSAAFQWINPKGWVMSASIISQFSDKDFPIQSALIISGVFMFVGFTSVCAWTLFGQAIQRWLTTDRRALIFNLSMAALMLMSIVAIAVAEFA